MDKLTQATIFIQEFIPLMEAYENALLKIAASHDCPSNLKKLANEALDLGKESVDEEELLEEIVQ